MAKTTVVIPCYDEAHRLPTKVFAEHLESDPATDFLFVDDGSRDGTLHLLEQMAEKHPGRIHVLALPENRGKAEAVRHGVLQALEQDTDFVGYLDADLSTPLREIGRLRSILEKKPEVEIVLGSRVQLLGRRIKRSAFRHYVGRFFATAAAWSLGLAVYDTQCGAKLFATSEVLANSLAAPFISRWAFDVELLGRMKKYGYSNDDFYEEPLQRWIDVAGSKVKLTDMLKVAVDLFRLWRMQRN